MLYDLVQCQHRPAMDLFGDPKKRDRISPFVRLLWEKGTAYEHEVIEELEQPILDLSSYHGDEKEQKTRDAIGMTRSPAGGKRREPLACDSLKTHAIEYGLCLPDLDRIGARRD